MLYISIIFRFTIDFDMRFWSCVAMTIVVPILFISENSLIIFSELKLSTLPVGSSASINLGDEITALAIAALCCSPPDKVLDSHGHNAQG